MSKIENLNIELESLNMRLYNIEASFNHVNLNQVQQLKPHVITRVLNTVYTGYPAKQRESRARDENAIGIKVLRPAAASPAEPLKEAITEPSSNATLLGAVSATALVTLNTDTAAIVKIFLMRPPETLFYLCVP